MIFFGMGLFGAADLARPTWRETFWRKANLAQGHFGASHLGANRIFLAKLFEDDSIIRDF